MASFTTMAAGMNAIEARNTTVASTSSRRAVSARAAMPLKASSFQGQKLSIGARATMARPVSAMPLVECALSREAKEKSLEKAKQLMENATFCAAFTYPGISVKSFQDLRRSLPKDAKIIVMKNTLIKKAAGDNKNWANIGEFTKGPNAYLFVNDDVKGAVKAFQAFQDKQNKNKAPGDMGYAAISGALLEGELLTKEQLKNLDKLPTKQEMIATIARLIKQPSQKIARGIKAVPAKVAYGVRAIKEKVEEEGKEKVADIVQ